MTVPAQQFKRGCLGYTRVLASMVGIQLGYNLPRDVRNGPAVSDCSGQINFNWVNGGHMVDDEADRTVVRLRHSCTPLRF